MQMPEEGEASGRTILTVGRRNRSLPASVRHEGLTLGAHLGHGPSDNHRHERSLPDTPDLPFAWGNGRCQPLRLDGFFLTRKRSWSCAWSSLSRPLRTGRVGVKLCKRRCARSALGPCHNGRARAWAVTDGRPRFGGTADRGPFGSSSWDDAGGRFRLWSRRSD
jgi:hypothetical protein